MRRKKRDSEDSIEKIETAAVQLFARRGYSNTSLEHVADVAGFTKGAVYYYFKTKEALLLHILTNIRDRSIKHTADYINSLDATAIDKLEAFVKLQAQWGAKHPDDLVVLIMSSLEFRDTDSPIGKSITDYYGLMETLLLKVFQEGKETGQINANIDVKSAVLTNIARHDGNMLLWHRSGCDPSVGRVLTAAAIDAVRRFGAK
jgi:AcrR family transcriptional regulator